MKSGAFSLMNASPRVLSIKTGNQSPMYRSPFKHLFVRTTAVALTFAALLGSTRADEPSVTAVLSSSEASVGEAVQLQIQVKGDRNAGAPSEILVDGLEIRSTGQTQAV